MLFPMKTGLLFVASAVIGTVGVIAGLRALATGEETVTRVSALTARVERVEASVEKMTQREEMIARLDALQAVAEHRSEEDRKVAFRSMVAQERLADAVAGFSADDPRGALPAVLRVAQALERQSPPPK